MADELPYMQPTSAQTGRQLFPLGIAIALILVIIGLVLVVTSLARDDLKMARRTVCAHNLKAIAIAQITYANDGSGVNRLGPTFDWNILVKGDFLLASQFRCPCADHPNYMYIRHAADAKLKSSRDWTVPIIFEPLENHDGKGGNVLFGDSYVKWYSKEQYDKILAPYKERAVKVEIGGSED